MQWSCHKHIPVTIMSNLKWNLHDMDEMLFLMIPVPSSHQLLSTFNKIFVLFVDNPPILIIGHTPIIHFVDNPPIYNSGHTSIIYCVDNPSIYNSGHTSIIYCVDNPLIYNSEHTLIIYFVWTTLRYIIVDILR